MASPTRWDALVDALVSETGVLTERIRRRLDAEFDAYGAVHAEALDRTVRLQLGHMLSATHARRETLEDAERPRWRRSARAVRARACRSRT
jgi:hypothetical protein